MIIIIPGVKLGLPTCLKELTGKWIVSPRNEIFRTVAQNYLLTRIDDEAQYVEIRFESGTNLRLHFWRFNLVIDIISEAAGECVMLGSRIEPYDQKTIEGRLFNEASEKGYKYAKLRTAAFVCDLIVLCGYAQYCHMINVKTGRKVQGIKRIF